jgi:hypothetical protein
VIIHRNLPDRESVFFLSLRHHGFRFTHRRKNLKYKQGYIIPATRHEDSGGIDAWVKMPKDNCLLAIQITQRGIRMYKKYHERSYPNFIEFVIQSEKRIQIKRHRCYRHKIAFVLVRDFKGIKTNPQIAWGDIKALRYAVKQLNR